MARGASVLTAPPQADLVIVGAGVAGLTAARTAAAAGGRVHLLTKGPLTASASYLAQGGVAAAIGSDDSPERHGRDTLAAGRGLCRATAVTVLVHEAPDRIAELRDLGVPFGRDLGLEGGHSRRRIHHVDGADTGRWILEILLRQVIASPTIEVSVGERVLAIRPGGGVLTDRRMVAARAVVLATGGFAALWSRTTSPPGSVGEGIELAHRSGAALADLEFIQFHPTVLEGSGLLLSEALRGEGAQLVDSDGLRFTDELASRDVVARAVGARGTALLDLRPIDRSRFPSLMRRITEAGHNPAEAALPVSAAAHFTMGGIVTDTDGRTDVPGLYAAGECACTGVHGANRLASNSLLEGLVFGRRAALAALGDPLPRPFEWTTDSMVTAEAPSNPTEHERQAVWRHAGLVRNAAGLGRLRASRTHLVRLLAAAALARVESRGGHFRADFPSPDPALDGLHTVIRPEMPPVLERWT